MNLKNYPRREYAIDQFTQPHCSELEGKGFHFIMDNGYDFDLKFTAKDFTIIAGDKEYRLEFKCEKNVVFEGKEYAYGCLKLELNTYFICFSLNVAIVDLEQCLVTLISGDEYVYGNIGYPDQKCKCGCSQASHGCAGDDMVGTNVAWILGCGRFTAQDFYKAGKCRVAWSPRENEPYEQPCKATKIKGPIYLVDIKGRVHQHVCAPFFTNRVIVLQDYDHMMTVGCVMGKGLDPILISGYAKFLN